MPDAKKSFTAVFPDGRNDDNVPGELLAVEVEVLQSSVEVADRFSGPSGFMSPSVDGPEMTKGQILEALTRFAVQKWGSDRQEAEHRGDLSGEGLGLSQIGIAFDIDQELKRTGKIKVDGDSQSATVQILKVSIDGRYITDDVFVSRTLNCDNPKKPYWDERWDYTLFFAFVVTTKYRLVYSRRRRSSVHTHKKEHKASIERKRYNYHRSEPRVELCTELAKRKKDHEENPTPFNGGPLYGAPWGSPFAPDPPPERPPSSGRIWQAVNWSSGPGARGEVRRTHFTRTQLADNAASIPVRTTSVSGRFVEFSPIVPTSDDNSMVPFPVASGRTRIENTHWTLAATAVTPGSFQASVDPSDAWSRQMGFSPLGLRGGMTAPNGDAESVVPGRSDNLNASSPFGAGGQRTRLPRAVKSQFGRT